MSFELKWVSRKAAAFACAHWHYTRTMPLGKAASIGVWEERSFRGALVFSQGMSRMVCRRFGVHTWELAELVRVALRSHRTPVSRMLAIACKMVSRKMPGLRVLVSFADTAQGHYGGIYQAAGWVYTGEGGDRNAYLVDGRVLHNRTMKASHFGKPWNAQGYDVRKIVLPPKHRYAIGLDVEMKARIEQMRQPYPKRATSIGSDAPANHAGEGGATPTVALHTTNKSR